MTDILSKLSALTGPDRDKAKARRHCNKCELPQEICACAEAKAYDKAFPFKARNLP